MNKTMLNFILVKSSFTLDSQQSKKGTRIIPPSYSAQFRKLSPHTAAVELMTESFTQSKLDGISKYILILVKEPTVP